MGNQVIQHHDLGNDKNGAYGRIRASTGASATPRFGIIYYRWKGKIDRPANENTDMDSVVRGGEFWINIMIPHTCITNGVFFFLLGQEEWEFYYVSRAEEEGAKCLIDKSRRISEGKANHYSKTLQNHHFPTRVRVQTFVSLLPSPLTECLTHFGVAISHSKHRLSLAYFEPYPPILLLSRTNNHHSHSPRRKPSIKRV